MKGQTEAVIRRFLYITNDDRLASILRSQYDLPRVTPELVAQVRAKEAKRGYKRPCARDVSGVAE